MDELTPEMARIISAKERRRMNLAALPFAEKVRILLQLQRMAAPILRARGREVHPWPAAVIDPSPLATLLTEVTDQNGHHEQDFGLPAGRDAW